MKIATIAGRFIGNMSIFSCPCCGPTRTEILRISDTDLRNKHELCVRALNDALRRLPEGYYVLFQHDTGYVLDFWVGKRSGVRVRPPYGGITINAAHQRPCLRVEVGL